MGKFVPVFLLMMMPVNSQAGVNSYEELMPKPNSYYTALVQKTPNLSATEKNELKLWFSCKKHPNDVWCKAHGN